MCCDHLLSNPPTLPRLSYPPYSPSFIFAPAPRKPQKTKKLKSEQTYKPSKKKNQKKKTKKQLNKQNMELKGGRAGKNV